MVQEVQKVFSLLVHIFAIKTQFYNVADDHHHVNVLQNVFVRNSFSQDDLYLFVRQVETFEVRSFMHYFLLYLGPFELVIVQILVEVLLLCYYIVEEHNTDEQVDQEKGTNIDNENSVDQ